MFVNSVHNCSIDINSSDMSRRKKLELSDLQSQIEIVREIESVKSELQQTRNEFTDYKAQQDEYYRTKAAQAKLDKKEQRRHELKLSAFTVCLTSFLSISPIL